MTHSLATKMQLIANQVNDLNSEGKVKAQTANEKGYAKLVSINNGCRVWAHHTLDDKLIIDLMFTKSAEFRYPEVVKSALATFQRFAKESNRQVLHRSWQHSINKSDIRQQYYFDITGDNAETMGALVEAARLAFQTPSRAP